MVKWIGFDLQAVVLFAMGGYGTYLGFRIRYSDDVVWYFFQFYNFSLHITSHHFRIIYVTQLAWYL